MGEVAHHILPAVEIDTLYSVEVTLDDDGGLDLQIEGEVHSLSCFSMPISQVCHFVSEDGSDVAAVLTGTAESTDYDLFFNED